MALLIYSCLFGFFGILHDYPQLRQQMKKVRQHDPIAERRQWLTFFYLINEAGSGLKFLLTGNEKYMRDYPSHRYLLAQRTAQAQQGDWQVQMQVARMYYEGTGSERNLQQCLHWLYVARDHAATAQQRQITEEAIAFVEAQQQVE